MEAALSLFLNLQPFINARWLEEMKRRQAEAVAARVAAEKAKRSHEAMSGENEQLRTRNAGLTKKVTSLEAEVKKLSGQQNLSQRIHHHAKIKVGTARDRPGRLWRLSMTRPLFENFFCFRPVSQSRSVWPL